MILFPAGVEGDWKIVSTRFAAISEGFSIPGKSGRLFSKVAWLLDVEGPTLRK